MKHTLHIILVAAMSMVAHTAHAQQPNDHQQTPIEQPDDYLQRLAEPDSLSGAKTEVKIHFGAEDAMNKYNAQTSHKESYQGYRIRIFSGNSQTARAEAEAAVAVVEENFKIPVYFAYENPYFLVTCGNCLSHEEAIILLSRVRRHFPKAFIVASEIPAEELLHKPMPALLGTSAEDNEESQTTNEIVAEEIVAEEALQDVAQ